MKLSVIIPVYNEVDNIERVLSAVENVKIHKEIIVVDDNSHDGTRDILSKKQRIKTLFHDRNRGKGAAIRSGLKVASGDYVIIQDADLEYSPHQYPRLFKPIKEKSTSLKYLYPIQDEKKEKKLASRMASRQSGILLSGS